MPLLIGLPLAAFALLFLVADPAGGRRAAAIHAALLWGISTLAITEILSLFHALTAPGLATAWLLLDLAAAAFLWRRKAPPAPIFRGALTGLDDLEIAFLAGVLFLLAGVAAVALAAPPNTTDVLVYHLPRIVHWLERRSVSFYATHEIRQLQMPPWAEYAMLQFHGLSGGDRFDNLVQWFSMAGSLAGVSLIAGRLGAGMRGQVLAAVLCATIPQGLLEASGAKNDWVMAFWLVALVWSLLRFADDPRPRNACAIGAALGLACLTKSIAFVLAPPVAAAAMLIRPAKSPATPRAWIRGLAVAALLALALNTPHFARNYRLFHSLLGPAEMPSNVPLAPSAFHYTNAAFGVRPLVSNVLRNLALDAGTPLPPVNRAIEAAVDRFLGALGENPNDPRTTWNFTAFHVPPLALHEATAGNALHAFLILVVLAILWRRRKDPSSRPAAVLALGFTAAFLLFCAVFKWQPWHTRLHLPLLVLWAAVLGTVLAGYLHRGAVAALGMLLLLSATPEIFANQLRPILSNARNILNTPRQELYFADLDNGNGLAPYRDAARFVESSHCPEIGLDLSQGGEEYLFDVLLPGPAPLRNVFVTNASRRYAAPSEKPPACLICPSCALSRPGWPALARLYRSVEHFGNVAVLTGLDPAASPANACTAEFSGWYPVEKNASDWWLWSAGKGVVQVRAAQALQAGLEAVVASFRYPNQVEVRVNGETRARLRETAAEPAQLLWIEVELRPGGNTLEFLSANPPAQPPQDPRPLAISLRNLAFRDTGAAACAVDPR